MAPPQRTRCPDARCKPFANPDLTRAAKNPAGHAEISAPSVGAESACRSLGARAPVEVLLLQVERHVRPGIGPSRIPARDRDPERRTGSRVTGRPGRTMRTIELDEAGSGVSAS
jgi:hypothetical protein